MSASSDRRSLVLVHHVGRDSPALTNRDAVVFRPGPDVTAALTACRGTPRTAGLCPPDLAGILDERRRLLMEGGGVLLTQVYLK